MKQLVELLARALVDQPEAVEIKVTPTPQDGSVLYELKVAPGDIGKVIGRDGRTVNALRTVLQHAAQKKGEKARLEIVDDRRNGSNVSPPQVSAPAQP
ncbi:MAG: KH domain-containing protein [Archangium sp.]|nr:KH domain-containing protein [Archangium sp.]